MTIKEAQEKVDHWITTIGVTYFSELTNLAILMEEVGEFARLIARKYGEQSFKEDVTNEKIDNLIAEELADIAFVLLCLANQMNIDLTDALNMSIDKKTSRDKLRHANNPKIKGFDLNGPA